MKLFIEKKHFDIINNILSKTTYKFYAFGSRVKGTQRPYSDLDLCYMEDIPDSFIVKIEGELEDSDLPFKVDFVNFKKCSQDFQNLIHKELILWDGKLS